MNSLKSGIVEPIYLLQGTDKFLQKFLSEKISNAYFDSVEQSKTLLIPDDLKGEEIINKLTTTDLFSSKKLFILMEPKKLKGNIRKEFFAYCDNPILTHCLIIILEDFGYKISMVKELTKRFQTINVSPPFSYDMKKWTKYFLQQNGIIANSESINKITDLAGDSVGHIANEIDKISIMLDKGQDLTEDIIEQFSGWRREHQRWEFFKALGEKDRTKSLRIGLSLVTKNEDIFSLIYPLTTFYQELLFAKFSPKTPPARGIYIGLSESIKKNIPIYVNNYSQTEIEYALKLLNEIDLRSKTTTISDETEMSKFIFKLFSNNE
jgi:DNA polymerase-3 subunit delta